MASEVIDYILVTWAFAILIDITVIQGLFLIFAYLVYFYYDGQYKRVILPEQLYKPDDQPTLYQDT